MPNEQEGKQVVFNGAEWNGVNWVPFEQAPVERIDVFKKDDGMREVHIDELIKHAAPGIDGQQFKIKLDDRAFDEARDDFHLGGANKNNHMIADEIGQFPMAHAVENDQWHQEKKAPQFAVDVDGVKWKDKQRMGREREKMAVDLEDMRNHIKEERIFVGNEEVVFNENGNVIRRNPMDIEDMLPREKKQLTIHVDYVNRILIMGSWPNEVRVNLREKPFGNAIGICIADLFPDEFDITVQ